MRGDYRHPDVVEIEARVISLFFDWMRRDNFLLAYVAWVEIAAFGLGNLFENPAISLVCSVGNAAF